MRIANDMLKKYQDRKKELVEASKTAKKGSSQFAKGKFLLRAESSGTFLFSFVSSVFPFLPSTTSFSKTSPLVPLSEATLELSPCVQDKHLAKPSQMASIMPSTYSSSHSSGVVKERTLKPFNVE